VAATRRHGDAQRIARDLEIAKLRARGETLQAIASRFGLSRERVRQVLASQRGAGSVDAATVATARRARAERLLARRRGAVLVGWRRGASVAEIAREVGLSTRAVRSVLARHADDADEATRRVALNRRSRAGAPRYSDAELIAAVAHAAALLGEAPTAAEYARLARKARLPSLSLIQSRIGWSPALVAARLESAASGPRGAAAISRGTARRDGLAASQRGAPSPRPRHRRWSEEACWEAVVRVAKHVGHAPSIREYARASRGDPGLPSAATVSQRLGGWGAVRVRLAGRRPDSS
jgi:lambda repressor-like predicted transcriptional regulator